MAGDCDAAYVAYAAYTDYRARVEEHLGKIEVGSYGKWQGRLVKVLDAEAFGRRHAEHEQLRTAYDQIMASGDTVNDAIMQLLAESSAELLLSLDD